MKGFPKEYLTQRIMARLRKPLPMEAIRLIYTEDESDKSVMGGTFYARRRLQQK